MLFDTPKQRLHKVRSVKRLEKGKTQAIKSAAISSLIRLVCFKRHADDISQHSLLLF